MLVVRFHSNRLPCGGCVTEFFGTSLLKEPTRNVYTDLHLAHRQIASSYIHPACWQIPSSRIGWQETWGGVSTRSMVTQHDTHTSLTVLCLHQTFELHCSVLGNTTRVSWIRCARIPERELMLSYGVMQMSVMQCLHDIQITVNIAVNNLK